MNFNENFCSIYKFIINFFYQISLHGRSIIYGENDEQTWSQMMLDLVAQTLLAVTVAYCPNPTLAETAMTKAWLESLFMAKPTTDNTCLSQNCLFRRKVPI